MLLPRHLAEKMCVLPHNFTEMVLFDHIILIFFTIFGVKISGGSKNIET